MLNLAPTDIGCMVGRQIDLKCTQVSMTCMPEMAYFLAKHSADRYRPIRTKIGRAHV